MKTLIAALASMTILISGCQTTESILASSDFEMNGSYGTVGYSGKGTKIEYRNYILFRIEELNVNYIEEARTNQIPVAKLRKLRLTATTKPVSGTGPWDILYKDEQSISATVSIDKKTDTITDISLKMPKKAFFRADNVGFSLIGDRLMWPLKPNFK